MTFNRRRLLALGLGVVLLHSAHPAIAAPKTMSASEAHAAAGRGDILLLDIRTRGEWLRTGIGETALPVSMHERSFLRKLEEVTGGDKTRSIALICATGGRSNYLQGALARIGYTNVIDVAEGMMGSRHGSGWLKQGLPVKKFKP